MTPQPLVDLGTKKLTALDRGQVVLDIHWLLLLLMIQMFLDDWVDDQSDILLLCLQLALEM